MVKQFSTIGRYCLHHNGLLRSLKHSDGQLEKLTEFISYEPATGAELWRGAAGNADFEVTAAREAWPQWAARPLNDRLERIRALGNRMRADTEKVADLIARETGKPLWEARKEVEAAVSKVDVSIKAYAERSSQRRVNGKPGTRTALRHKPLGVLAVLTGFSEPLLSPVSHIVPALIAGNSIVFKPSQKTPASGQLLIDYIRRAGIPEGVVRILQGDGKEGRALAAHPGIEGLLFTGSTRTGIALHKQFSNRPDKLLSLELGGNNPVIVWDNTDLHSSAVLVINSAFVSAGQNCAAARRLIVKEDIYEPFVEEVKRLADRLIIGEPLSDPAPFMGPLIDNDAADVLTESFVALMSHGGKPIKHMARPIEGRPFVTPGIIDVSNMVERPDIELFGPLLQVVRAPDFERAIDEANNTNFGLSAALIGGTAQQYDEFWANSRAGIVNWNAATTVKSDAAPLGGVGMSGNHRPGAYYASDNCAYPVVSSESEVPKAMVGIGLKEDEYNSPKEQFEQIRSSVSITHEEDAADAANVPAQVPAE